MEVFPENLEIKGVFGNISIPMSNLCSKIFFPIYVPKNKEEDFFNFLFLFQIYSWILFYSRE